MAWHFRKRVKIIPGLHLNFSKSGVSTTIGGRGGSITFSKRGTTYNASIPGLGISNRIFEPKNRHADIEERLVPREIVHENDVLNIPSMDKGNIFSVDVHEITSAGMEGIKESILLARNQRAELSKDLSKVKNSLVFSKVCLFASKALIYGFVFNKYKQNLTTAISAKTDAIGQLKEHVASSYVALNAEFDPTIGDKYNDVISCCKMLNKSNKIWDITKSEYNDRVATRAAHSSSVNRVQVQIDIRSIPDIKSDVDVVWIQNANGADIYIYPSFVIMYSSSSNIGVIGLDELYVNQSFTRFVERESVPTDSRIIEYTWDKVNKNGSRDKRFKDNYQIPIVEYCTLSFSSKTGLNEEYQISNTDFAIKFYHALVSYQQQLTKGERA
jgi:hypothetical protein